MIQKATQIDALTSVLHSEGDRDGAPLLISMDQEGGAVQRLQYGVEPVPSASRWQPRATLVRPQGRTRNGRSLRDLGVTMVLAPVADHYPTGTSSLGSRTYGCDLRLSARMVVASVKGYLDAGVVPVVKHFPGIGTVPGDSHGTLVHQTASLEELKRATSSASVAPSRRVHRR